MNAQAAGQVQSAGGFLNRQNLMTRRHPKYIREFRLPERRRLGFVNGCQERPRLLGVLLGSEQHISDYIGINDGFHGRPAEIHASISRASGRRLWRLHAASICSSTDRRSET